MGFTDSLHYEGIIIRPPNEARSIILQATVGCSHNRCTFCPTYKAVRFRIKERAVVEADLVRAARLYPDARRLFVADGDALVLPMDYWHWLLPAVREKLPWVHRVGVYASGRSVRKKTDEELLWLREHGLGVAYLGVESGDDETLRYVRKGCTAGDLLEAGHRLQSAGIKLSVTVLLGIAPPGRAEAHARETGRLLSALGPDQVGALSVMVCEGTELADRVRKGEHPVPPPRETLFELRGMLESCRMTSGLFLADHASNYLSLRVRMPREKESALRLLDAAIEGRVPLRPEECRGL